MINHMNNNNNYDHENDTHERNKITNIMYYINTYVCLILMYDND